MTIEKLPSGSYRIKQMENGKRYSITVPYKPKTKEAFELIQNKINRIVDNSMPFQKAAEEYISIKDKVLSPSTIRGYRAILRNMPEKFLEMDIAKIDEYALQKFVNDYSTSHTPKTVRNVHGFIMAVLRLFYPKVDISVTLPQKQRQEQYTPSAEDVKRIMEASKDSKYYIPLFLACLGLRNSEICAATIFDLKGNELTINKALVYGNDGFVLKNVPKTDASNRIVVLPDAVADSIRDQGYVYDGYPRQIDKHLYRIQKKLNMPTFGIHRLRHFFASYMHELGYSDAIIQALGGWSTDNVMKSVYRHALDSDEARKAVVNDFSFL